MIDAASAFAAVISCSALLAAWASFSSASLMRAIPPLWLLVHAWPHAAVANKLHAEPHEENKGDHLAYKSRVKVHRKLC